MRMSSWSSTAVPGRRGDVQEHHCRIGRYRLSVPPDLHVVRRQLEDLARVEALFGDYDAKIWSQQLPFAADSATAERMRATEMRRTVSAARGWRAVVLNYSDGLTDLILVGNRAHFDGRGLDDLAETFRGRGPEPDSVLARRAAETAYAYAQTESPDDALVQADLALDLEWAAAPAGDRSPGGRLESLPLSAPVDVVRLVAAIGISCAGFCQAEMPVIAVLAGSRANLPSPAALVPVDTRMALTADLMMSLGERLRYPMWHTSALETVLAGRGQKLDARVALAIDPVMSTPVGVDRVEYSTFTRCPYPLTFEVAADQRAGSRLVCRYAENRFSAASLQHFVAAVATVYGQLGSASTLDDIRLSHAAPVAQSAAGPSNTDAQRIDELVTVTSYVHPDATAVVCGDRRITYRDLNEHATRIAHSMHALGVERGDRVGLLMERSIDLLLVMLAAWKAGASYVPIDRRCPLGRAHHMMTDSGMKLLVCDQDVDLGNTDVKVVRIADLLATTDRLAAIRPLPRAGSATDEAYVIYTSGSTGKPKGVSVPHVCVERLLGATGTSFSLSSRDVWTLFHSPAFDFSIWEIWVCLLTGGTLVIVPYETSRDSFEFQRLLARERVTVLSQTPSAFEHLIEAGRREPLELAVRLVVLGGEALNATILLPWFDRLPESVCRVVNMYGITETTVHVTAETLCRHHALARSKSVGRPIAGWQVFVVDQAGRALPPGAVGEIWVGGAGVANGYVNQPHLTAERFITVPGIQGRVYRSGDLGRVTADGRLEHLGRLDNQVKLRGFRIELDEIRAVLLEAHGVDAAAVLMRRRTPDDPASACIAAFVVLSDGTAGELKRHVSRLLPDYMVPSEIIAVSALPLTANGKVDVRLLAALQIVPVAQKHAEPSTDPSGVVRGAFAAVLGVSVHDDDNFFDLGGNSLAAVRVVAHLQGIGIGAISPRDIYSHQTSAELAKLLSPSA